MFSDEIYAAWGGEYAGATGKRRFELLRQPGR